MSEVRTPSTPPAVPEPRAGRVEEATARRLAVEVSRRCARLSLPYVAEVARSPDGAPALAVRPYGRSAGNEPLWTYGIPDGASIDETAERITAHLVASATRSPSDPALLPGLPAWCWSP